MKSKKQKTIVTSVTILIMVAATSSAVFLDNFANLNETVTVEPPHLQINDENNELELVQDIDEDPVNPSGEYEYDISEEWHDLKPRLALPDWDGDDNLEDETVEFIVENLDNQDDNNACEFVIDSVDTVIECDSTVSVTGDHDEFVLEFSDDWSGLEEHPYIVLEGDNQ